MAGVGMPGGDRRSADNNLNLVPFVDLFSTLIIFMIATTVMNLMSAVPISLGVENKAAPVVAPPDTVKKINSDVKITVGIDFIELFEEGKVLKVAKTGEAFDYAQVETFIEGIRTKFAAKKDMLIFSNDDAKYETVVAVMDRCLAKEFDQLIVTGSDKK
jgi:biopolymer transport protein ExbD